MSKEVDYLELTKAMNQFIDANREKHGTHAYALGYLEVQCKSLIMNLPPANQAEFLEMLRRNTPETVSE